MFENVKVRLWISLSNKDTEHVIVQSVYKSYRGAKQHHFYRSVVFIVNFEQIQDTFTCRLCSLYIKLCFGFFTDLKFLLKLNAFKSVYATAFLAKYLGAIVFIFGNQEKNMTGRGGNTPTKNGPNTPCPPAKYEKSPSSPLFKPKCSGTSFCNFFAIFHVPPCWKVGGGTCHEKYEPSS